MSEIKKILFITLSNIGDVILTLPVLDTLKADFPQAKITVLVGPRPKEIFQDNPNIDRLIIYDKHSRLRDKIKLFCELKKEDFDMAVDLRNSFFGAFLPVKYKNSPFLAVPKTLKHMKERHLFKAQGTRYKAQGIGHRAKGIGYKAQTQSLFIHTEDELYITGILNRNNISTQDKIIIISAGARSHIKQWGKDKFIELILSVVKEFGVKIILAGDKDDAAINEYITKHSMHPVIDLSGKTSIAQLACLLNRSQVLVTNDSANLHLASYLNVPVVAIFGPTNEHKYGPWSDKFAVVKKEIFCRPCEKAQCRFGTLDCMRLVKPEDVFKEIKELLFSENRTPNTDNRKPITDNRGNFKRILIVRTDRIGDVLLSTPVIKALRDAYPNAFIAMMVSPYAKDIIEGNPYLDEALIYDKESRHKSLMNSVKFALKLKQKKFDLALILHPTNRVHLITFFAGIRRRFGYDRKLGFLLTRRIKHTKQFGEKHELEYNLDLVRYLGIEPQDKNLFIPINADSEKWADEIFKQKGINGTDKLLAIHPGASCPSKIWPNERFAQLADKLVEKYGFKVLFICGSKDLDITQKAIQNMRHTAINLAGKTSISQLASILRRCHLFISNDSGPVHIASAVGVPVISIFGRSQKGLSPKRWGPVGKKDKILHKEVSCIKCLAHNCTKEFACLKAITVDDVIAAADSILKS